MAAGSGLRGTKAKGGTAAAGSGRRGTPQQGVVVQTERGGERHLNINGTVFRIPERYNHLEVIGKGSYGMVCSAVDSYRKNPVAIKKISPMAAQSIDAKHVLREVRIMRYLGTHENIVTLEDLFCNEADDELYIVMELLASDLHRIIQSPQKLSMQHKRVFMLQILRGVDYLHQNGIIHRDLKPGNLLVTRNCELRISDFGLARERPKDLQTYSPDIPPEGGGMTEHVITRWYRPPELMLSPNGYYNFSVDVWSIGCIFGELLGRRPLFPGSSFIEQLSLIFDVIGSPAPSEVEHIRGAQARKFLLEVEGKAHVAFTELLPGTDEDGANLLDLLLRFDPEKRCTPAQGLLHPFFASINEIRGTEVLHVDPPENLDFDFERKDVSHDTLKTLIAEEIDYFQSGANLHIHSHRTHSLAPQAPPPVGGGGGGDGDAAISAAAAATKRASFSSSDDTGTASRNCSDSGSGDEGEMKESHYHYHRRHHQQQQQHQKSPPSLSSPAAAASCVGSKERRNGIAGRGGNLSSNKDKIASDVDVARIGGCRAKSNGSGRGGNGDSDGQGVDASGVACKSNETAKEGGQRVMPETKVVRSARRSEKHGKQLEHSSDHRRAHASICTEETSGARGRPTNQKTDGEDKRGGGGGKGGIPPRAKHGQRATNVGESSHGRNHALKSYRGDISPAENQERISGPPRQNARASMSPARNVVELESRENSRKVQQSKKRDDVFSRTPPLDACSPFSTDTPPLPPPEPSTRRNSIAGFVSEDASAGSRVGWVTDETGRWHRTPPDLPTKTAPSETELGTTRNSLGNHSSVGKKGKNKREYDPFVDGEFHRAPKHVLGRKSHRGSHPAASSHISEVLRRQRAERAWQVVRENRAREKTQRVQDAAALSVGSDCSAHDNIKRTGPSSATKTAATAMPRGILRKDGSSRRSNVLSVERMTSRSLSPSRDLPRALDSRSSPSISGKADLSSSGKTRKKVGFATAAVTTTVTEETGVNGGEGVDGGDGRWTTPSKRTDATPSTRKTRNKPPRQRERARARAKPVATRDSGHAVVKKAFQDRESADLEPRDMRIADAGVGKAVSQDRGTNHGGDGDPGGGCTPSTAADPIRAPIASVCLRRLHAAASTCCTGGVPSVISRSSSHGSPPAALPPLGHRWKRDKRRVVAARNKGGVSSNQEHHDESAVVKQESANGRRPAVDANESKAAIESEITEETLTRATAVSQNSSGLIDPRTGGETNQKVAPSPFSDSSQLKEAPLKSNGMNPRSTGGESMAVASKHVEPTSSTQRNVSNNLSYDDNRSGIHRHQITVRDFDFDHYAHRLSTREAARVGAAWLEMRNAHDAADSSSSKPSRISSLTRSRPDTSAIVSSERSSGNRPETSTAPITTSSSGQSAGVTSGGTSGVSAGEAAAKAGIPRSVPSYVNATKTWKSLTWTSRLQCHQDISSVLEYSDGGRESTLSSTFEGVRAATVPDEVSILTVGGDGDSEAVTAAEKKGGSHPKQGNGGAPSAINHDGGEDVACVDELSTAAINDNFKHLQQLWIRRSTSDRSKTFGVEVTSSTLSSSRSVATVVASTATEQSHAEDERSGDAADGCVRGQSSLLDSQVSCTQPTQNGVQSKETMSKSSKVPDKRRSARSTSSATSCTSAASSGGTSIATLTPRSRCRSVGIMPASAIDEDYSGGSITSASPPGGRRRGGSGTIIPSKVADLIPFFPQPPSWRRVHVRVTAARGRGTSRSSNNKVVRASMGRSSERAGRWKVQGSD